MFAAAIPYLLQGASLVGGIFGRRKQKTMDPEYIRTHFGAEAISNRAQELAQRIMSSPYGQQLMASAAESGQQFQNDMGARAAASGLSPDTGGQSAASDFAVSAAGQAQSANERGARASVFQSSLPIAQDLVANEQAAAQRQLDVQNAQPTLLGQIGQVAGGAAAMFPQAPKSSPYAGVLQNAQVAAALGGGTAAAPQALRAVAPTIAPLAVSPMVPQQPLQLPKAVAAQNSIGGAVQRGIRGRRVA